MGEGMRLIKLDPILPVGHVVFDDLGAAFGRVLAADAFDEIAVGICLLCMLRQLSFLLSICLLTAFC